jgi:hypothetical protein
MNDMGAATLTKMTLDPAAYSTTIYGLQPGTMYTIYFGYKDYNTGDEGTVVDVVKVTTKPLSYSLTTTKVGLDGIHFNLKLNRDDGLDQNPASKVVLYLGSSTLADASINMTSDAYAAAFSDAGYEGIIVPSSSLGTSTFRLELEGFTIEGNTVNVRPDTSASPMYAQGSYQAVPMATQSVPEEAPAAPPAANTADDAKAAADDAKASAQAAAKANAKAQDDNSEKAATNAAADSPETTASDPEGGSE